MSNLLIILSFSIFANYSNATDSLQYITIDKIEEQIDACNLLKSQKQERLNCLSQLPDLDSFCLNDIWEREQNACFEELERVKVLLGKLVD